MISLSQWFNSNNLFLNGAKSTIMQFRNYQNIDAINFGIHVNGQTVNKSNKTKFLGATLDELGSWRPHCETIISSVNRSSYALRYLRNYLNLSQLRIVYFALTESRLRYVINLWGATPWASHVFIAQKRALRCIAGVNNTHSCKNLFSTYKIMTLIDLYILEMCLYIFRNKTKFILNENVHTIDTRNKGQFRIPFVRNKLTARSHNVMGLKIFNALPTHISELGNFSSFKNKLKIFLLENNFYSIKEYFDFKTK